MLNLDVEDLTLDEVAEIENITGVAIDDAFNEGAPKGKALKAFAYVLMLREDPSVTLEQVGRLKLSELPFS